jgi:hypothetical protein
MLDSPPPSDAALTASIENNLSVDVSPAAEFTVHNGLLESGPESVTGAL